MTRAVLIAVACAVGCVRPAPLGLASVQVCVTAETAPRWEGPQRPTKGASVCASFERAPEPAE